MRTSAKPHIWLINGWWRVDWGGVRGMDHDKPSQLWLPALEFVRKKNAITIYKPNLLAPRWA